MMGKLVPPNGSIHLLWLID